MLGLRAPYPADVLGLSILLIFLSIGIAYAGCPGGQHEENTIIFGKKCVPDFIPTPSHPIPNNGSLPPVLPGLSSGNVVPSCGRVCDDINKAAANGVLKPVITAQGDVITTLEKAQSDTVATFQKANSDIITTYEKAWRDTGAQAKRSFNDAVDAGKAVARFEESQRKSSLKSLSDNQRRLREGKIVDSLWHLGSDPAQASDKNFAKAVQESAVLNTIAQGAASFYGGPAGAAAYAAWYTYHATGDASLAIKAGILSAIQSGAGGSINNMPSATATELLQKAAVTGAAAGIATAASGGDKKSIQDAFLKSGGAVLIQSGTQAARAYSPDAANAVDAVQCISARDPSCLSKTTYARDAMDKIRYDSNGQPRIDPHTIDTAKQIGRWVADPQGAAADKAKMELSQLPDIPEMAGTKAIPVFGNKWVLTWKMQDGEDIKRGTPSVVLTQVGNRPLFSNRVSYLSADKKSSKPTKTGNHYHYRCRIGRSDRTIVGWTSPSSHSCKVVYKTNQFSEVVWRSTQDYRECSRHVPAFLSHMRALGISCAAQQSLR